MYKDFYIFNLTNPNEFARGAKPSFKELGPYRYRYVMTKHNSYIHNGQLARAFDLQATALSEG